MPSRNLFASFLMALSLAVGFLGIAAVANAASAWPSFLKAGESATNNNVIEIKHRRGRGPRVHLPIGPAYIYYDYPYYYSRGYYPTHVGGYVYYPYQYSRYPYYSRSYYPRYAGRCSNLQRRCVPNRRFGARAEVRRKF